MGMNFAGNQQNITLTPTIKDVFRNNEITIYTSVIKNNDNINRCFYVSNNIAKFLNNVKVTFSAPKHLSIKVVNTTGTFLEPNQGLGVKKVIFIILLYKNDFFII